MLNSSSREDAESLSNRGYAAIHGSPQAAATFERASIDTARAVITDAGNANVNTILTVRTLRPDVDVIALTDDSDVESILRTVGADTVLSPHAVLGHRLAEKAVASFSSELRDTIEIGGTTKLMELPVSESSELVGRRIRDTNVRERTGANIVGAWFDGELQLPPSPDAVVCPDHESLADGVCERCLMVRPIWLLYECRNCRYWRIFSLERFLYDRPPVVSFFFERGVDLVDRRRETASYVLESNADVTSDDPLTIQVRLPFEGDVLRLELETTYDSTEPFGHYGGNPSVYRGASLSVTDYEVVSERST